jgi:hypothetical protein
VGRCSRPEVGPTRPWSQAAARAPWHCRRPAHLPGHRLHDRCVRPPAAPHADPRPREAAKHGRRQPRTYVGPCQSGFLTSMCPGAASLAGERQRRRRVPALRRHYGGGARTSRRSGGHHRTAHRCTHPLPHRETPEPPADRGGFQTIGPHERRLHGPAGATEAPAARRPYAGFEGSVRRTLKPALGEVQIRWVKATTPSTGEPVAGGVRLACRGVGRPARRAVWPALVPPRLGRRPSGRHRRGPGEKRAAARDPRSPNIGELTKLRNLR